MGDLSTTSPNSNPSSATPTSPMSYPQTQTSDPPPHANSKELREKPDGVEEHSGIESDESMKEGGGEGDEETSNPSKIQESENPIHPPPNPNSKEVQESPVGIEEHSGIESEESIKEGGGEGGGEEEGDGDGEEEGECGFCLFMKGGGCKETFTEWEKCVEEGEELKEDIVEKCFQVTAALKTCMEAHSDYYAPLLQAEKAAQEEAVKQLEEEKKESGNAVKEEALDDSNKKD